MAGHSCYLILNKRITNILRLSDLIKLFFYLLKFQILNLEVIRKLFMCQGCPNLLLKPNAVLMVYHSIFPIQNHPKTRDPLLQCYIIIFSASWIISFKIVAASFLLKPAAADCPAHTGIKMLLLCAVVLFLKKEVRPICIG